MKKHEVIERMCALSAKVGSEVFKDSEAYDCFCRVGHPTNNHYQFSEDVLKFIETAVAEKIAKGEKK